jgi:hypothetical protein
MAANKIVTLGPVALTTTTTTNVFSPPTLTGGTGVPENSTNSFYLIKKIRVVNRTGTAASFALWLDATGGNTSGKEFVFGGAASAGALTQGVSVGANSFVEEFGNWRISAADTNKFIVGGAGTATALTIEAVAEIGVV